MPLTIRQSLLYSLRRRSILPIRCAILPIDPLLASRSSDLFWLHLLLHYV